MFGQRFSSIPSGSAVPPAWRHGGTIKAGSQLPVSGHGESYLVSGNASVTGLPVWPKGTRFRLTFLGAPTFVNSSRLVCPNGINKTFAANESAEVVAVDDRGTWAVHPMGSANLDTDTALAANSDAVAPSQKAIKTYAAPLDAHASNGMQINGTMLGSVEFGAGVVNLVSGTDKYITDGHVVGFQNSGAAFTSQQIACPGTAPPGFDYCLQLKSTTAVSSYASSDWAGYHYAIEALTFRRMMFGTANAQPVTVGFWLYATAPGTFVVALRNNVPDRSYPVEVTIDAANTWEFKTVTFPGDTSGTWQTLAGTGAYFGMMFGAGSTYQGTPNTWQAGNKVATSGLSNFFASNNNVVCMTGVVILPGTVNLSSLAMPRLMRDPIEDTRLWQRYYRTSFGVGTIPGAALGGGNMGIFCGSNATNPSIAMSWLFGQRMRATPTMIFYDGAGTSGKLSYYASGAWSHAGTINGAPLNSQGFYVSANITDALYYNFDYVADARLPVA